MNTGQRAEQDVPAENAQEQLLAVNEALVLSLMEAQARAQTSARLLDDMARSIGTDVLTRLPSHVFLLDRMIQAMAMARLHQNRLSLVAVGVTNFRDVVRQLGKEVGDKLIRLVASRIMKAVGTVDTVSRHGPQAFLVLLPEVLLDETEAAVQRIAGALDAPFHLHDDMPALSLSMGAAFFPDHTQSPTELIGKAEAAMHRAAQRNERALVIFDPSMQPAPIYKPGDSGGAALPRPSDAAFFDTADSPLQAYLCGANEQLLVASLSSIDEKERAERALRRQTEFLAVLAHELRSPLTPISLASAMMGDVEPDQIPRLQGVIKEQIAHISRLLTDLLDVSRINTGKVRMKREVVNMVSVIRHVIDNCGSTLEARHQALTTAWPKGTARVFGDPMRLAQVFTNLLDNASKYTPNGGSVGLRVEVDDKAVIVTVSDSGVGISAEALLHIFEPFVQDRSTASFDGKGLGIGLTVVREMVEAHGGEVHASSRGAHLGATFTVILSRLVESVARR